MSVMDNLILQGNWHFISSDALGTDMQKPKAPHRSMRGPQ